MRKLGIFVAGLCFILAAGFGVYVFELRRDVIENPTYKAKVDAYARLLRALGPSLTQEIMSTVPNTPRLHTVNHVVGDVLFQTLGIEGISECKPHLTYSCFHGFIAAAVYESGFSEVTSLARRCAELDSEEHRMQCVHGMGHGFLEQVGVDELPVALSLCKEIFAQDEVLFHCFKGVFMENAFGPFTRPSSSRWFRPEDPTYPCFEEEITALGAERACYDQQFRGLLSKERFPQIGGDSQKAYMFCAGLQVSGAQQQCLWGLTWDIQARFAGNVQDGYRECERANVEWSDSCRWLVAQHAFYFGDRSKNVLRVCEAEDSTKQQQCLDTALFTAVRRTWYESEQRERGCGLLGSHAAQCREAVAGDEGADDSIIIGEIDASLYQRADTPLERGGTFYPSL